MSKTYPCLKGNGGLCVHEACRPQGPISEELKRTDQAAPADVIPQYKASVRFGRSEGPNLDWESPYEITVHGPAAFIAHVVSSAADGFEEDAQR